MQTTTYGGRAVREPGNGGSNYEQDAEVVCDFCGSDVYGDGGERYCSDECRDLDGRAAAADAAADLAVEV